MKTSRKQNGFTLIELMVVIAIIGLLSSIVLSALSTARANARDTKRLTEIREVRTALELYAGSNGYNYPTPNGNDVTSSLSSVQSALEPYAKTLPTDPLGSDFHEYLYVQSNAKSYAILVRFEGKGYCKVGQNMNTGWWNSAPVCDF